MTKSYLESLSSASELMSNLNLAKLSRDSSPDLSINGDGSYNDDDDDDDPSSDVTPRSKKNSQLVYPHPASSITTPTSTSLSSSSSSSSHSRTLSHLPLGLNPTSQRQLNTELKRLRLGQHQYEMLHSFEERKIITRMALKLARSSTNLDSLIAKNNQIKKDKATNRQQQQLPKLPAAALPTARSKTTGVRPSIAEAYFSDTFNETLSDDFASNTMHTSATHSSMDGPTTTTKKTVRWQTDLRNKSSGDEKSSTATRKMSARKTNASHSTATASEGEQHLSGSSHYGQHAKVGKANIYELSKKYVELRLKFPNSKPISILPKLVAYRYEVSFIWFQVNNYVQMITFF
jgi:hypothetical protein